MSLQPLMVQLVPEETAGVARAAFLQRQPVPAPLRPVGAAVRRPAARGALPDAMPAGDLARPTGAGHGAAVRGRLVRPPAADAVRGRIDWKYAVCLPLEDEGFDASVLSEFRARLIAGCSRHCWSG